MRQSKLLELLRTFSGSQWRRFGEFLYSPYWNKSNDLQAFFQYLSPFHPAFNQAALDKKVVLQRLTLRKPPDEKSLAYLMSQCLALAEKFLMVEALDAGGKGIRAELLLLEERQATLPRHRLNSLIERARKKLALPDTRSGRSFQQHFELALLEYETQTDHKQLQFNALLQNAVDALDDFYLFQKFRLLAAVSNVERLLAVEYRTFWTPEFELVVLQSGEKWRTQPAISAWFHAWQLNRHDDPGHFERLLDILAGSGDSFTDADQKLLYFYALNFCVRRINRHNEHHFYEKYIDLHDILLAKGLLLENGELLPRIYLNLVAAGLRCGRTAWTWQFLNQWNSRLPAPVAENLHHYCLAQWHYFQQDYDAAQKNLVRVEFQDFLLALGARCLWVKLLYETGQTELLFAALEADRLFLLRARQIEPGLRRQVQQFIDFTRRLAKIDPPDRDKLLGLAARLPAPAELIHRDWLVDMIERRIADCSVKKRQ